MIYAAWKTSLAPALWPVSFAALANAPARYALAMRERQFGFGFGATLALAVLADLACLGPLFALALTPAELLTARRPGERSASRVALVTAMVTVALVTVLMWAVSVGATEFRIQRGTYPALVEAIAGLSDPEFIRGSAKVALFERYTWPTLAALFAWAGLLAAYGAALVRRRTPPGPALRAASGPAVASLGWAGLAGVIILLFRTLAPAATSDAWIPPLIRFAADVGSTRGAIAGNGGVGRFLSSVDLGAPAVRSGLHLLGFGDDHALCVTLDRNASCGPHPLARPLPGNEAPSGVPDEDPTPLVRGFLALSAALFDGQEKPVTVWHVALESFRADDVHALHPAAPAETTPFINAAYAPAEPAGPRTIAFRHAFQSGLRTAQAVSGLWCGLGALPFQLALSRDLTDLPLRCMPDVLRDAGFETRLYYGSHASFEHLDEFAGAHGLTLTDISTMPRGLPGALSGRSPTPLSSTSLSTTRQTLDRLPIDSCSLSPVIRHSIFPKTCLW